MKNAFAFFISIFILNCENSKSTDINSADLNSSEYQTISPADSVYSEVTRVVDTNPQFASSFDNRPVTQDNPVYKVNLTGLEYHMNIEDPLWKSLSLGLISELNIEADTLVVESEIHFPSTKLSIKAQRIIFKTNALIDLTPNANKLSAQAKSQNGSDGLNAPDVFIDSPEIVVEDPTKAIIISKGGRGQDPGPGSNGIDGTNVELINETFRPFRRFNGALIGVEPCHTDFGGGSMDIAGRGSYTWPGNGQDAAPGGYPGPGGNGGNIYITSNSTYNWNLLVSLPKGNNGEALTDYKGGQAGLPRHAVIIRCRPDYVDQNDSIPGNDAHSPSEPNHLNSDGSLKVESYNKIIFSRTYFEKKIQWIRDLYLDKNYTEVQKELTNAFSLIPEDNKLSSELSLTLGKLETMNLNLILQKDYFGKVESAAPLYSLDIDISRFNAEIDRNIRIIYLASIIGDQNQQKQNKITALNDLIEESEKESQKLLQEISINEGEYQKLEYMIDSVNALQSAYEQQILDVSKNLEARAKSDLEFEKKTVQTQKDLKAMLAIVRLIPAGQPEIGLVANAFNSIISASDNQSTEDWFNYLQQNRNSWKKLTETKNLEKSKKECDEMAANFNASSYNDKSPGEILDRLVILKEKAKPLIDEINKQSKIIKNSVVSQNDIDLYSEKLKSTDSLFLNLITKAKEIQSQKANITNQILNLTLKLQKLLVSFENQLLLKSQSVDSLFLTSDAYDSEFNNVWQKLSQDAEERLFYFYAVSVNSFEYATLTKLNQQFNLGYLATKIHQIVKEKPVAERIQAIETTYRSSLNYILKSLSDYLESKDSSSIEREAEAFLILNSEQVSYLNDKGELNLKIDQEFYGFNRKKILIKNIELIEPIYELPEASKFTNFVGAPNKNESSINYPRFEFELQLVPFGSIVDLSEQSHIFTYSGYDHIYRWIASTDLIGSNIRHRQNPIDHSLQNLIGVILQGSNITLNRDRTELFARHAGITEMNLYFRKEHENPKIKLKGLTIKLDYTYIDDPHRK